MIRYVPHASIDKVAWDMGLERCTNRFWYGLSATLDAAAPGWDALIDDESGSRMALPWGRKWGIKYAYQPFLLQRLGPFSTSPTDTDTARFVEAIPAEFRFADIYLCPGTANGTALTVQRNLTLDLSLDIGTLRNNYSDNHRRNVRKSAAGPLVYEARTDVDELIHFLVSSDQFARWGIDHARKETMARVFRSAAERGEGFACGMRNGEQLVAGAFFVHRYDRLIFLKGLANGKGRDLRAMHGLIDRVVAEHAGHPSLLDFAGTNDPDLARFYSGFGAVPDDYLRALINRLPFLLRKLKA